MLIFQTGSKQAENGTFFLSKAVEKRLKMAFLIFQQSGNEAVKNGSFLLELKAAEKRLKMVLFDVFKEGRNWREIFPVKQGKYRVK